AVKGTLDSGDILLRRNQPLERLLEIAEGSDSRATVLRDGLKKAGPVKVILPLARKDGEAVIHAQTKVPERISQVKDLGRCQRRVDCFTDIEENMLVGMPAGDRRQVVQDLAGSC